MSILPWPLTEFKPNELGQLVKLWLSALFQSEHLSLLIGSGLTPAIHKISRPGSELSGMRRATFNVCQEQIEMAVAKSSRKADRGKKHRRTSFVLLVPAGAVQEPWLAGI